MTIYKTNVTPTAKNKRKHGRNPLTNEVVDSRLIAKNRTLSRVGQIINATTKIEFKCNVCHYTWLASPDKILNQETGCPRCNGREPMTNTVADSRLIAENRNITRIGQVVNSSTKIEWKCDVCHSTWMACPNNVVTQGSGCQQCAGNEKLTNDIIDSRLFTTNRTLKRIGQVINAGAKIEWKCNKCNNVWRACPNNILNHCSDCPTCNRIGLYCDSYFSPDYKTTIGLLYLMTGMSLDGKKFLKIGITKRSTTTRFGGYGKYQMKEIATKSMTLFEAFTLEQKILKKYIHLREYPDNNFGGRTECLRYDETTCEEILHDYFKPKSITNN